MDASFVTTLGNSRLLFGIVTVAGMAICSAGIGKAARLGLWVHPVTLTGYALGVLALLLAGQGLLHWRLLPVTNTQALAALLGVIVLKLALAALYRA